LFHREIIHNQKIIITDGMPSSGKALLCDLVSSLPKVDTVLNKFEHYGIFYFSNVDIDTEKDLSILNFYLKKSKNRRILVYNY